MVDTILSNSTTRVHKAVGNRFANVALSANICSNHSPNELVSTLKEVFEKKGFEEDLWKELKEEVALHVFVSKDVRENYEIYRMLQVQLVEVSIEVLKVHITGALLSRRIISII